MATKRALCLRAAGINCDGETVRALELAGAKVELTHVKKLLAAPARLDDVDLVVIPGGFSYGDDVAAGRVLGLELRHGLAAELARFVDRGGYVLGVCNGFQVLVESGLFEREPGSSTIPTRSIALTDNASNRFECRWVRLRVERSNAAWLSAGETWPVPVAHGEGRFVTRDAAVLARLERNGQIALRYVDDDGAPTLRHPHNPNGSAGAVAGICDLTGRVLGLMPHPERNLTPWNHPTWTRDVAPKAKGEGVRFYAALVEAAASALVKGH